MRLGTLLVALALFTGTAPARATGINWQRAWGKDAVEGNAQTGFEVCEIAAQCQSVRATGTPLGGELTVPADVAVAPDGDVYVTDRDARRVAVYSPSGAFKFLWGRDVVAGNADTGAEVCSDAAQCKMGEEPVGGQGPGFHAPASIAIDGQDRVYVTDHAARVLEYSADGTFLRSWGKDVDAGNPSTDREICVVQAQCQIGTWGNIGGEFDPDPQLAVSPGGDVYVTRISEQPVQQFTASGTLVRAWGVLGTHAGEFESFSGIAVDHDGNVYIGDSENARIQRFSSDGVFQYAIGKDVDSAGLGTGFEICTTAVTCQAGTPASTSGAFEGLLDIGVDAAGDLYATDSHSRIQRFAPSGAFIDTSGYGVAGGSGFETCATVDGCQPGVAGDKGGQLSGEVDTLGVNPSNGVSLYTAEDLGRVQQFGLQSPALSFDSAAASVPEASPSVTLPVTRSGSSAGAVSATWTAAAGTATSPADFTAGSGTVSFAVGQTTQTISVPINDDPDAEGDETFTVALSAPTGGATLSPPTTTTVTIVDDDDVDTTITSGPAGPTSTVAPAFGFTADIAGSTYECAIDAGVFAACPSPFTVAALADGSHTFRARAVRPNGVKDATPATRTFFVDTAAPTVTLAAAGDAAPGGFNGSVTVSAAATDPAPSATPVAIACVIDPPSPPAAAAVTGSCPATVTGAGQHTAYAVATDAAGNRSTVAATSLRIFPDRPDTKIISDPFTALAATSATIRFEANPGEGATFECRLDDAAFAPCPNPSTLGGLTEGQHTFRVRAVSAGGLRDDSPAEQAFFVDTHPPAVSVDLQPVANSGAQVTANAYTGAVQVRAVFGDPDPSSGVAGVGCSLDPATVPTALNEVRAGSCVSPATTVGDHVAYVVAYDRAGNESGIVSTRFSIVLYPDTLITGPSGTIWTREPTFQLVADPPGASIYCRIDGTPFVPCSSPYTTAVLKPGPHTIEAAAQLGNARDPSPASRTFTVGQTVHRDHGCVISPFARTTRTSTLGCEFANPCTKARVDCKAPLERCPAGAVCSITTHLTSTHRLTGSPVPQSSARVTPAERPRAATSRTSSARGR